MTVGQFSLINTSTRHLLFHSLFYKHLKRRVRFIDFRYHPNTMTIITIYGLFGFLLLCGRVCALQKGSIYRNRKSVINHGNFIPDLLQYLSATKITSILVKDENDCSFECIGESNCSSFNVAAYPDSQGLYLCELLNTDRYGAQSKLQANASFHHYSPWVSYSKRHNNLNQDIYSSLESIIIFK